MKLTMTGRLSNCALLSFGTPAQSVRHLVPEGLKLMVRGDRAFWNVVTCRVDHMRPKHLPPAVGVTYHHVAYRLLVQAMTQRADVVQGLYFVRSDADARMLGAMGNRTTDFKFHAADVALDTGTDHYRAAVTTPDGAGNAYFELGAIAPLTGPRHPHSAFATHADAREWLTYRPLGLSIGGPSHARRLRLAEVHRNAADWLETEVELTGFRSEVFEAFDQTAANGLIPERVTRVAEMNYEWRLGRTEPLLTPCATPQPVNLVCPPHCSPTPEPIHERLRRHELRP